MCAHTPCLLPFISCFPAVESGGGTGGNDIPYQGPGAGQIAGDCSGKARASLQVLVHYDSIIFAMDFHGKIISLCLSYHYVCSAITVLFLDYFTVEVLVITWAYM